MTPRSRRELLVLSATLVAAYAAVVTELLSTLQGLTRTNVAIAWGMFGVMASIVAWRHCGSVKWSLSRPAALEIVPMLVVFTSLAVTLFLAIACPPNNWDVILYHLPRQVQWLQQAGVQHFPTQDYRLTVNPPLMEYLGSQLMLMFETDRLNSIVSWCAFALTLVAVSLLAKELGVNRLGQWIAVAFAATIPMAIHEAASGKNDGLVAFWLIIATWWLMKCWKQPSITWQQAMVFGTTLGLLSLTKGTGAVFAAPIVVLALLRFVGRTEALRDPTSSLHSSDLDDSASPRVPSDLVAKPPRSDLRKLAGAFAIALAFNAPHLLRNYQAYGSLAGQTFGLGNERHTATAFASNLLRNLSMHLALPNLKWNASVERWVARQHSGLGLDVSEPLTTWGGQTYHLDYAPHKEHAATPIHFVLCLVAALVMLRRMSALWLVYWCILFGGFLAFCIAFKWQPWHPRLHLPLFTLACASVGWLLSQKYLRTLSPMIVAGLIGAALPSLFKSESRALTGSSGLNVFRHDSETLRFLGNVDARDAATVVVDRVGARSVDLVNHGALPWEYPLTRRLKLAHNPRRVGYFYVVGGSPPAEPAEVVVDIGDHPGPRQIRNASGVVYLRVAVVGPFTLYEPGTPIPGEVLDHAVGRFGIGAEPPQSSR